MRAVWMVRGRQMEGRFNFWLGLVAYDRRDRSISNRLYLVYLIIFFSIWGFAVLTLLAGVTAGFLKGINPEDPGTAAVASGMVALLGWFLYRLFATVRRSPINFTEDDAQLICQTPVDRRAVAIAWFPGEWLNSALFFWAIVVTLSFALEEIAAKSQFTWADLPVYITVGLRALILVLPVHLSLLELVWAVGILRLRRADDPAWVKTLPFILVTVLVGGLLLDYSSGGTGWQGMIWQVSTWLVRYPLLSAFRLADWGGGLALGMVEVVLGLLALWGSSGQLNLSRAAQESQGQETQRVAILTGSVDALQELAQKQKLGTGHPPSQLPLRPGLWSLMRKDVVQSLRLLRLGDVLGWLFFPMLAFSGTLSLGWGPLAWVLAIWAIQGGQSVTRRLQKDLQRWWLLRSLPFASGDLLLAEMCTPWLLMVVMTWLGLAFGIAISGTENMYLILLVLPVAASVGLGNAADILRQSHSADLMVGKVPGTGFLGAVLGLAGVCIPLAVMWGLQSLSMPVLFGAVIALGISGAVTYTYYQLAEYFFQHIK